MLTLITVILPVFLVTGFGYWAVWRGYITDAGIDGLMKFAQSFAIPCLLFSAISGLDLSTDFEPRLLASYYLSALIVFALGLIGARLLFQRPADHSVAIGFCGLFSNSVLLGLAITERAYGPEVLKHSFTIIAIHAPFCYTLGIISMEIARAKGAPFRQVWPKVARAVLGNALILAIGLGFVVNLTGLAVPGALEDAVGLMARAALPAALFGLGGVLVRYRPEGEMGPVLMVCLLALVVLPSLIWLVGQGLELSRDQIRAAVLTGAMAPGINTYIFANMYGVARRVAATGVLIGTGASVVTAWIWLAILP